MVLVRVHRITSVTDPETGRPGKQIELVEVRRREARIGPEVGEMGMMVRSMMDQLRSMGFPLPTMGEVAVPKLIIFLSENEYDMLGIRLEVNDMYELVIRDGSISLRRPEGV